MKEQAIIKSLFANMLLLHVMGELYLCKQK